MSSLINTLCNILDVDTAISICELIRKNSKGKVIHVPNRYKGTFTKDEKERALRQASKHSKNYRGTTW